MGLARPLALAVIRREDEILVQESVDTVKDETFYRPLGGTIEFGERGEEAVLRELEEEIGASARVVRFLGVLENIFTYLGQPGHELVLVYEVALTDEEFYRRQRFSFVDDNGDPVACIWKRRAEFGAGSPLYPDGLLELLPASD